MQVFKNFKGKKILVTGHTGFKGTWLSIWLKQLGATVYGVSLDIPSNPSHFTETNLSSYIDDYNSSNKFSFINFSKKIIDNVNSNINLNLGLKFKYDLKDFIYSIEFFESMVCFNIDKSKTYKNQKVFNKGIDHNIQDLTWKGNEIFITKIRNFLRRIPLIRFNRLIKRIKNRVNNNYIKKFFE